MYEGAKGMPRSSLHIPFVQAKTHFYSLHCLRSFRLPTSSRLRDIELSINQKMANLRRALISAHRLLKSSSFATARAAPGRASTVHPSPILRAQQHIWFLQYSTVSSNDGRSLDIDLSNEESKRRLFNRLVYRSKQRGYLELDLVLGKWVEENIHSMDENGIKALADVLDLENPDLWKWLIGQEQAPDIVSENPVFSAVRETITNNLNNYSAPETRATPGKPWVRGWDDIKKGLNSPVAGNQ